MAPVSVRPRDTERRKSLSFQRLGEGQRLEANMQCARSIPVSPRISLLPLGFQHSDSRKLGDRRERLRVRVRREIKRTARFHLHDTYYRCKYGPSQLLVIMNYSQLP